MDTGTHLVMGLGLAGLAHIDPVVADHPTVATAVLVGTVLGQQAPDLDGLLRIRSNAAYIRNHRGPSHSLPAVLIWTALITLLLFAVFGDTLPLLHVGGWVLLAVASHVLVDLFNSYGTQALRPFSNKWISWNIIHIFDPILFSAHVAAILLWAFDLAKPQVLFPALYGIMALYFIARTIQHAWVERRLPDRDAFHVPGDRYIAIPTIHPLVWNIVKQQGSGDYLLGEWRNGRVKWADRVKCDSHPAVEASKHHPDIAAFLYFSSYACAEVRHHSWGYEVRWIDVRYRHRKQYPFVAALLLGPDLKPIDSYVGWLSEARLRKKLQVKMLT